jgi:hypothetical protein
MNGIVGPVVRTAWKKRSVTPTERLKFREAHGVEPARTNSRISG